MRNLAAFYFSESMKKVKILEDIKIYSKGMFVFEKGEEPVVKNELAYRLVELKKAILYVENTGNDEVKNKKKKMLIKKNK